MFSLKITQKKHECWSKSAPPLLLQPSTAVMRLAWSQERSPTTRSRHRRPSPTNAGCRDRPDSITTITRGRPRTTATRSTYRYECVHPETSHASKSHSSNTSSSTKIISRTFHCFISRPGHKFRTLILRCRSLLCLN